MASKLFFDGHLYTTPTTVSAVDDTAFAPVNPNIGNAIVFLGESDDGAPNAVLAFGSPRDATAALGSGELLDAVTRAFAPSDQTGGPGTVKAVRAGQTTQAAALLNDAQGSPSIVILSRNYGPSANAIQVKVEAGTTTGLRVTTTRGQDYFVGDNLAGPLFTVTYSAGGTSPTIQVTATAVVLSVGGTAVATIDRASSQTIGSVVSQINGLSGFAAVALPTAAVASTSRLDVLAATAVSTTPTTIYGNAAAVLDWLNGPGSPLVGAAMAGSAVKPPAPVAYFTLAGGTTTAPVLADWVAALELIQGEDVQWVVALSGDPAVHVALDAHVKFMSGPGKRERRAFSGPPAGTPLTAAVALPKALNSDRTSLVWPGFFDFDVDGNLVLFPPYMSAALVAAGFAGLSPGNAMTNKTLSVRGLEASPRNPVDTDLAIQNGLLCLEDTPKGFKVVRSISTWLVNDNFNRVEVSCGAATDYAVAFVRQALDVLRGGRQDPRQLVRAKSITETALTELAVPPPIGPGVIVGDAKSPAFRAITASIEGDIIHVSWEMSPVIPTNFITASVAIVPFAGTITSA